MKTSSILEKNSITERTAKMQNIVTSKTDSGRSEASVEEIDAKSLGMTANGNTADIRRYVRSTYSEAHKLYQPASSKAWWLP